jgi:hypothetical protein
VVFLTCYRYGIHLLLFAQSIVHLGLVDFIHNPYFGSIFGNPFYRLAIAATIIFIGLNRSHERIDCIHALPDGAQHGISRNTQAFFFTESRPDLPRTIFHPQRAGALLLYREWRRQLLALRDQSATARYEWLLQ